MALIQALVTIGFVKQSRIAKAHRLTLVFSLDQPEKILTQGLFRYVRHPFYSLYLICYISSAIFFNNWFLWILISTMAGLYWFAAVFEENKFLSGALNREYKNYQRNVGMFFPKFL
jgi:protein-S-isoprenylcysteine O-methyltransferase Ste14